MHIHLYVLWYLFDKYSIKIVISFYMNKNEVWNLFVAESGGINDADADLFSDASSATGESIQSSKYSSSQSSAFSRSTG